MADSLKMGSLSLNESQHAPAPNSSGRAAYIPPHLRQRQTGANMDGAPAAAPPAPGPSGPGNSWGSRYVSLLDSPCSLPCRVQVANHLISQRRSSRWQLGQR